MVQPGWEDERTDTVCAEYRGGQWLICRALEVVLGGWIADDNCGGAMQADLPLEDMIYAAAHAYLDSRGTGWITAIFFDAAGGSS